VIAAIAAATVLFSAASDDAREEEASDATVRFRMLLVLGDYANAFLGLIRSLPDESIPSLVSAYADWVVASVNLDELALRLRIFEYVQQFAYAILHSERERSSSGRTVGASWRMGDAAQVIYVNRSILEVHFGTRPKRHIPVFGPFQERMRENVIGYRPLGIGWIKVQGSEGDGSWGFVSFDSDRVLVRRGAKIPEEVVALGRLGLDWKVMDAWPEYAFFSFTEFTGKAIERPEEFPQRVSVVRDPS
jgi:hypothetical protein